MLVLALLLATSLSACGSDSRGGAGGPSLAGVVREPALQVGGVSLPNASDSGAPMHMRAPQGELLLVYFGYTSCPDICPTTLSDISVAVGDLPAELAERIRMVMVTVDPEVDTAEVLTGYLGHFLDRSAALRTDDPEQLEDAAEAFGVQYEVEEHEPGEPHDVAHSAITYVVDDTGTVVVEWTFGFESSDMTNDLKTLLTEEKR
jgi:protein SCO1/2